MKKGDIFRGKEVSAQFVAVVGCMDGRPSRALVHHLEQELGHYVFSDGILRPGMDKLGCEASEEQFTEFQKQIDISKDHGSEHIYVGGHKHCAGNPSSTEEEQKEQTRTLARRIKEKNGNEEVIAVWLYPEWGPNDCIWNMEVLEVL